MRVTVPPLFTLLATFVMFRLFLFTFCFQTFKLHDTLPLRCRDSQRYVMFLGFHFSSPR